ncbi:MAG: SH3 domain-containing protein [Chloroflexota bacterium]
MDTYWLVATLICLLLVDFLYRLHKDGPRQPRTPWTIPASLLILTILTAIFCLGLTWRYYVGTQQSGISNLESWLPAVITVMAIAIVFGFIESWRGTEQSVQGTQPKPDLYDLLETSYPTENEPQSVNRTRISQLARQASILAISLVFGWSVTSYLVSAPEGLSISALFPDARVRPTVASSRSAADVLITDVVESTWTVESGIEEHTDQAKLSSKSSLDQEENHPLLTDGAMAGANSLVNTEQIGTGGPLREVSLEGLAPEPSSLLPHLTSTPDGNQQSNQPSTIQTNGYYVVIQAVLGVKARVSPSTAADVITTFAYKEQLMALARTPDRAWIQIQWIDSTTAWIFADATGPTLRDHQGFQVDIEVLPEVDIAP